ncbi:hypothetical protein GCM10010361_75060 [Streptomyces olivaceiscleroticus]|uniref:Uncharacterized protein n=1 Tax=Streptomyces olivaceiscleroticus TaxID=68245 RepID=A0ABP3LF13_9ACTN
MRRQDRTAGREQAPDHGGGERDEREYPGGEVEERAEGGCHGEEREGQQGAGPGGERRARLPEALGEAECVGEAGTAGARRSARRPAR